MLVGPRALSHATIAAGLAGLVLVSLLLRTTVLDAGYWTDEAIAIGIAKRPLGEIPVTLRLDGSPPLYYFMLHGWIGLFGTGEAATRSLSLILALLAIPAGYFAGRAVSRDYRAGWLAAAALAALPYLTIYAQETRMYTLVVLLSVAATGCFAALLRTGATAPAVGLTAALVALLYTHTWAIFLCGAFALAWLWEWRRGRASLRTGLMIAGVALAAWLPWLPSLLAQAQSTGAPWASAPQPILILAGPPMLGGAVGGTLLTLAVAAVLIRQAVLRRRGTAAATESRGYGVSGAVLVAIGIGATALAWTFNQFEPAWAGRYLAITAGPLVIGAAVVLRRAAWLPVLVAVVGVSWVAWSPPAERSNARSVAATVAPRLGPGDAVIAAGPHHVPVIAAYMPAGLRWSTTTGPVTDTAIVDWRDLVARIRATPASELAAAAVADLRPAGYVVLVRPFEHTQSDAPLRVLTRQRGLQLAELLDRDPRLRRVRTPSTSMVDQRSSLRVTVWQRVQPGS